jgi:hypothetical protein
MTFRSGGLIVVIGAAIACADSSRGPRPAQGQGPQPEVVMSTDPSHPESGQPPARPLASSELAPTSDAIRTLTGLVYRVLRAGTGGDRPGPRDRAVIRMTRWAADGRPIESVARTTLALDRTEPVLAEAVQIMAVGQVLRMWNQGPSGPEIADLELLAIERTEPPRVVPAELRSPSKP